MLWLLIRVAESNENIKNKHLKKYDFLNKGNLLLMVYLFKKKPVNDYTNLIK